jgi:hypothetical protein
MDTKDQILNLYEEIFQEILECEGDLKKQGLLLKNKNLLIDKINILSQKYNELINEVQS